MKTIYKYPFQITDEGIIRVKSGAEFIHVGLDPQGQPCVWFVVNTDTPYPDDVFFIYIIGTGSPFHPNAKRHLGSFTQGPFMWHAFTE